MSKTPHQLTTDEIQAREEQEAAEFAYGIRDENGRAYWGELANETPEEIHDREYRSESRS